MSDPVQQRAMAGATGLDRRRFLAYLSGLGLATSSFSGALWAAVSSAGEITKEVLMDAERMAGLEFSDGERELMLEGLNELVEDYAAIRAVPLRNSVPPALQFSPVLPGMEFSRQHHPLRWTRVRDLEAPADPEDAAFLSVTHLAELVRSRRITSEALTQMYLERLERYDPVLHLVISRTEERALEEAIRADRELARGIYRGPLHGIPWGAKDLLAVPGYPTTWGAVPYRGQRLDEEATVARRLRDAGAVLVAKLTLGALAWGNVWFSAKTRNPWNLEQGSSGSSAGSAAATAAGLVGFSIGSETWGSIVSPSTRCGVTGLRPTFGRVSRQGAMALAWSMDKLGPICRSVEDCALVFHAVYGPDGLDPTVVDLPFNWTPDQDLERVRVGYVPALFEAEPEDANERQWLQLDRASLEALRRLGFDLVPIELPDLPVESLALILSAEAAAAFDELTRSGQDDLLVRQEEMAWPNVFRQARMIPAVEYIQANRVRTLLMREMQRSLTGVDVYVAPSFGGDHLLLTNLTGHPAVVLPNGFRQDGTPTSITLIGQLFGESQLLAVAKAYQDATGFHLRHPQLPPEPTSAYPPPQEE